MTEQCPLCGKEKTDGQDYCVTSGCGWHFRNDASLNLIPTPEHSYVQSEEKWEEISAGKEIVDEGRNIREEHGMKEWNKILDTILI